jgi:hypothetical protein
VQLIPLERTRQSVGELCEPSDRIGVEQLLNASPSPPIVVPLVLGEH